ncbi:MAG TPA: PLP-dependent aspartate aminotransferase family protein [Bryobacteraceae bacterium]|nr:PLP-dependent aspartate aminotransferase family protein [Bryobacteraceae bacterium]
MAQFRTLAIHAGQQPDPVWGAVITPIVQTSTFAFEAPGKPREFDYSRSGNPTRQALESCLAALEGGTRGFAFATGMAAETTVLMLFAPGDEILVQSDLYGGTYRLLTSIFAPRGVRPRFVDLRDSAITAAAINNCTRGIWIESPTNPLMNLVDLGEISAIARKNGLITICDNTFLSPYFQRPLEFDIDIVVHSTTKYINGHSDVVGGALIVSSADLAERVAYLQNALGTCAAPQDCFLVLRGIRTLALRMEEHNRNALAIARWLERHPAVESVLHPGLESHPQYELGRKQMTGYGGTFSFWVRGGREAALRALSRCRLFILAESLGGVESLIEHPRTMTHASVPVEILDRMGICESLIRLSVGIEDSSDLIEDLTHALGA